MNDISKVASLLFAGMIWTLGAAGASAQCRELHDVFPSDWPDVNCAPPEADLAPATEERDWMQLCQAVSDGAILKMAETSATSATAGAPTGAGSYVPWKDRYGQAYPGDFWRSMGRDAKELLPVVWDDTKAVATNPVSLVGLGLATAAGITLNNTKADSHVAGYYTKHGGKLNGFWDTVGDVGGNPGTHFAIAGAAYVLTLATGDTKNYEAAKSLTSALIINGLVTEALKIACHTKSPNGDTFAFPSGHTSSTFTVATVVAEYYGPWAGVPAYAFAGYVGYERIDARNHQFSDVIAGALIGMAIGHGVVQNHKEREMRVLGMDVVPYIDSERNGFGVALVKSW